jgi:hypothetical protein
MTMATIKNYADALYFLPGYHVDEGLAARFGRGLEAYWAALADGLAAARAYQELTRRGVPHDEAVREVFKLHLEGR